MGLFDKIAGRSGRAPGPERGGYDFVEIPTTEGAVRRMSKSQFDTQPLEERIRILVRGNLRFLRGDQVVSGDEALKSDY